MIEILGDLNQIFDYLSGHAVWWGLMILALSAIIEYVVPPFPGDSITLVGAVLIPRAGWPVWGVFGAVMVGTVVGASFDWWVGRWLSSNDDGDTWLHRWIRRDRVADRVDQLRGQFEKWGSVYLMLNRFVPAFRAVFFVAAGLAELDWWKVVLFGGLSAALWNGAILGVGYAVGAGGPLAVGALRDLLGSFV
ncbi:MAG: DedA family protein, partial [Bradymonadaceae bacterium]